MGRHRHMSCRSILQLRRIICLRHRRLRVTICSYGPRRMMLLGGMERHRHMSCRSVLQRRRKIYLRHRRLRVTICSYGPRRMMLLGGMGRHRLRVTSRGPPRGMMRMMRRRRDGTQGGSTKLCCLFLTLCCLFLPPGLAILSTLGLGLATVWHGEGYVAEYLRYVSAIEGQR